MTRLQAQNLAWDADRRSIVSELSASFEPGTFTGLLGPNGSGKSTFLRLLGGVYAPSHGSVTLDGRDLSALRPRERARFLALVEQQVDTGLDLDVREVVELGRTPHRGRLPFATEEGAQAIELAMEAAEITHLAQRRWATLSGGERQRTQLARALAQEPGLLLLDEPTNHLDLSHQIDLMTTLRRIRVTTIAALHDLEMAAAYCDRLIVMFEGRIVADGAVEDVLTAELLAEVYGVRGRIIEHPDDGRPHLIWSGVTRHESTVGGVRR